MPDAVDVAGIMRLWAYELLRQRMALSQTDGQMGAERLTEKLKRASGVAQRATQHIEARADALLERETLIEKRTEEVFRPHEAVLASAEKGLDDAEAALRLLSNDPLDGSTSGFKGESTDRPLQNGRA